MLARHGVTSKVTWSPSTLKFLMLAKTALQRVAGRVGQALQVPERRRPSSAARRPAR